MGSIAARYYAAAFIGDHKREYMDTSVSILQDRHGNHSNKKNIKKRFDFDYEPIEALQALLKQNAMDDKLPELGGASQLLKLYSFGDSLPIVVRTNKDSHFLLGRRLHFWEKTEYPILDLTGNVPSFIYPMKRGGTASTCGSTPGEAMTGAKSGGGSWEDSSHIAASRNRNVTAN